jgi:hypothetical protein
METSGRVFKSLRFVFDLKSWRVGRAADWGE